MYERGLQKLFLLIPLCYLLSLTSIAFYRSSQRKSVITASALVASSGEGAWEQDSSSASKLQLQEFHRIEIKDGKPLWEIRAKDAKYYPQEFVTHVNGAALTIFREKHQHIDVRADAARLYLGGSSLTKAMLDGNITISVDESFDLHTEQAEFDAVQKLFKVSGHVAILGDGFEVNGIGLTFPIDTGIVQIQEDVHCKFLPGAHIPEGVDIPGQ